MCLTGVGMPMQRCRLVRSCCFDDSITACVTISPGLWASDIVLQQNFAIHIARDCVGRSRMGHAVNLRP